MLLLVLPLAGVLASSGGAIALAGSPSGAAGGGRSAERILDLSYATIGPDTQIRVKADGRLNHQVLVLASPPRLVLDFEAVALRASLPTLVVDSAVVERVRASRFRATPTEVVRIVVDLRKAAPYWVESADDGLTVHVGVPEPAAADPRVAARQPAGATDAGAGSVGPRPSSTSTATARPGGAVGAAGVTATPIPPTARRPAVVASASNVTPGSPTLPPAAGSSSTVASGKDYRIGPADVLKITVWGHEDLTRVVAVAPDGRVLFPLVGDVQAGGRTPVDLETRLRDLLGRDYLVDPQVSVTVQEYKSQKVFVLGEAERPGTYVLTGQTSLLDVLSQAGGPSKTAGRFAVVVRAGGADAPVALGAAGSTTIRVNLKRLLDGDTAENLALQSGDTVYVPKQTGFYVLGEVKKPGAYTMEKDTSALEAVTMAGGFTERAGTSLAQLLRKREDGTQQTIPVDLSAGNPRAREIQIEDGDTLMIPPGNTFYIMGEVKKPGAYQLEQAASAIEGIALAGGFTDKAAPNRTKIIRKSVDGKEETLTVDLNEVIKRGRKDKDVQLRANDVVVVPESYF